MLMLLMRLLGPGKLSINPRVDKSRWPSVLARGLEIVLPVPPVPPTLLLAIEFFRTRPPATDVPLVLSRLLFFGRAAGLF